MSTNWNFNVKLILYSTQYAQVVLYTFKKKNIKIHFTYTENCAQSIQCIMQISISSMLVCMHEQTFVTAGWNWNSSQNRYHVYTLLHLSVRFAVRQTGRPADSWRWKRPWRLPLPSVPLVRSERSVMAWNRAEGDLRRWESKVRMALGASTAGPLWERGPPPPSFPPVNLRTSSKAHPSPAPLSSRTQDNALYSLITLSNWRALRSRALGIIKTNQHESFFSSQPLPHPLEGESRGENSVWWGFREKKRANIDIRVNGQPVGRLTHDWWILWAAEHHAVNCGFKTEIDRQERGCSVPRSFSGGKNGFSFITSFEY